MSTPFNVYLAQIAADVKGGKATEYTYRSALEHLIELLAPGGKASSDLKHKCGAPEELLYIIEAKSREVHEALAIFRMKPDQG